MARGLLANLAELLSNATCTKGDNMMQAHSSIKSYSDLVTSHKAVRDGFLEQALKKTTEARPYIAQALRLQTRLQKIHDLAGLIDASDIRDELVAAAGFSDKSAHYFAASELEDALLEVLGAIEADATNEWRSEIVFRFLLTRGDSLGGAMRNITGALAQVKFTDALVLALARKRIPAAVVRANNGKTQKMSWAERVLVFDRTPRFVGKNIDVILLKAPSPNLSDRELLSNQSNYLACGELKGGIDPAGADEHWKTAKGAFDNIQKAFPKGAPKLFFIGAAIAEAMAQEIFQQLQSGELTCAANLNVREQVADLAEWLLAL